ncbi:hypothetical protein CAL7102_06018 [Dulcicalothrix desertica PCC 7102]|nr:hypothetical protein CAL7102_06018 [Dulcicalothrix desertica PCC 7102]
MTHLAQTRAETRGFMLISHKIFNQGYQRVTYNLDPEHLHFYYKDAAEYTPVMSAKSVVLYDKVALTLI